MTPKVYLAVVHRSVGLPAFWRCLSGLQKTEGTMQGFVEGTSVAQQRNACVINALAHGATHVCFLDDDHVFAADTLQRLLARQLPIVGAAYVTRSAPFRLTAMHDLGEEAWQSVSMKEADAEGLVKVSGIGMGFTLIERRVFEAIEGDRWFELGQVSSVQMGEDLAFCRKAKAAGFQTYLDTRVPVGHLTLQAVYPTADDTVMLQHPDHAIKALTAVGKAVLTHA